MTTEALFAAVDAGQLETVRSMLAAEPSLAAARDADGVSAVMHALYRGHRPAADVIAEHLPSLDILEAAGLGRVDAVETLIRDDSTLASAWSTDGFTALHFAAFFGGGAAARALLDAGADPNVRSRNEFAVMPIHSAIAGGHHEVVTALLDAGADPNVHQRHGWTPLQGAAEHGDTESVDRLLAAGADPAATNDDGVTAADLARSSGHADLASRLESAASSSPASA